MIQSTPEVAAGMDWNAVSAVATSVAAAMAAIAAWLSREQVKAGQDGSRNLG